MTMVQALRSAHDVMMARDENVVVYGEDVGYFGGVFRVTEGLQAKYGKTRCFDAPISESGIVATGLRCRDATGRIICSGVSALLFTHLFINVAMTIGKMPITGIPLPLVSYGGSFTTSTMALLGLVQSVAIHGGGSSGIHVRS